MLLCISWRTLVCIIIPISVQIQPIQTLTMISYQLQIGKDFHSDVTKPIPRNSPKHLITPVDIYMFVDSNHTGDKQTRCSHSGFVIYANKAIVDWNQKHQATIETGVFGAEFVAMKTGVHMLDGATHVYGDNMSVIKKTPNPESRVYLTQLEMSLTCRRHVVMSARCCKIPPTFVFVTTPTFWRISYVGCTRR